MFSNKKSHVPDEYDSFSNEQTYPASSKTLPSVHGVHNPTMPLHGKRLRVVATAETECHTEAGKREKVKESIKPNTRQVSSRLASLDKSQTSSYVTRLI